MATTNHPNRIWFLILVFLVIGPRASSEDPIEGHSLSLPAGKSSVIRFFYQPPESDYFPVPLLFRVVKRNDPRWNTTSYSKIGLTAFVSLSDMQQLVTNLAHLSLQWSESSEIEPFESFPNIRAGGYGMGIKILSAKGTAKALIEPAKICETLALLDGALITPRALWEFQRFRLQYRCRVPDFNLDAYPSDS